MHDVSLISTLAAAFGLALVFGFLASKLRLPTLLGYLVAGILIGPGTPGFVADLEIAGQLAEIGVMLLMFGVGLHFSLKDLLAVRRIAIPGALVQMGVAASLGMGLAWGWGWSLAGALVFGVSLSVASTVVLLKALESRGLLATVNGRITVGWLVIEDLATVLILVLLPPLASGLGGSGPALAPDGVAMVILRTLALVAAFVALMLGVGRRVFPWLLWQVSRTGSRELFTLSVIAAAISIAYGSAQIFGVSFALGAFFAGMVMRESALSHRAAQESLPLRDAFAVLFFVSVGMLFQPSVIWERPWQLTGVVAIILLGKTLAAAALVLAFRYPLTTALTVSAGLAQIGEFSFILAGLGVSLGLMPAEGHSLLLAGALISIALNPVLFAAVEPLQRRIRQSSDLARLLERSDDPLAELPETVDLNHLTGQVVLVGYGRIGQRIGESLRQRKVPFVVAEQDREIVEILRQQDIPAVSGALPEPVVLIQAHVARASVLILALSESGPERKLIATARALNPGIRIIMHAPSDEEAALYARENLDAIFVSEKTLVTGMVECALDLLHGKLPDPQSRSG